MTWQRQFLCGERSLHAAAGPHHRQEIMANGLERIYPMAHDIIRNPAIAYEQHFNRGQISISRSLGLNCKLWSRGRYISGKVFEQPFGHEGVNRVTRKLRGASSAATWGESGSVRLFRGSQASLSCHGFLASRHLIPRESQRCSGIFDDAKTWKGEITRNNDDDVREVRSEQMGMRVPFDFDMTTS